MSHDEKLDLICRQTTYTREEANEKLLEYSDPMIVIEKYMLVQDEIKPTLSTNQMIYSEIRNFIKTSYLQRPEQYK